MGLTIAIVAVPLAFLCAGLSFLLVWYKRPLPIMPAPARFTVNMPPLSISTIPHYLTNVAVELVRADPQWWTKCLSFLIVALIVLKSWR
jgi:hypothetical protein